MTDALDRLTKIAARAARPYGVKVATYASGKSFDVLCERRDAPKVKGGVYWVRSKTSDAYTSPCATALRIRREIKAAWQ